MKDEIVSIEESAEIRSFMASIWLSFPYDPEHITVEDAAYDIENWKAEEVEFPEDLTPEIYAKIWNSFVDQQTGTQV